MKYAVTGGAGFIGSNLVDQLIKEGHEVLVLDNLATGKKENLNNKCEFLDIDISFSSDRGFKNRIIKSLKGVDTVFHLAALARVQPSIENPKQFNKANIDGVLNMLLCAAEAGVRRFVYSGSSSAYGNAKSFPLPRQSPQIP